MNMINQIIDRFSFKSRPDNTPTNLSSDISEFGFADLVLNVHINIF